MGAKLHFDQKQKYLIINKLRDFPLLVRTM